MQASLQRGNSTARVSRRAHTAQHPAAFRPVVVRASSAAMPEERQQTQQMEQQAVSSRRALLSGASAAAALTLMPSMAQAAPEVTQKASPAGTSL